MEAISHHIYYHSFLWLIWALPSCQFFTDKNLKRTEKKFMAICPGTFPLNLSELVKRTDTFEKGTDTILIHLVHRLIHISTQPKHWYIISRELSPSWVHDWIHASWCSILQHFLRTVVLKLSSLESFIECVVYFKVTNFVHYRWNFGCVRAPLTSFFFFRDF